MAHPDLEKILVLLLDSARGMLDAEGRFLPFAAVVDVQGRLSLLDAEPEDEIEVPIFVEAIQQGLRRAVTAGDIVAAGMCADVHVDLPGSSGSSDAICAQLERENGECFDVYLPYRLEHGAGALYAEPFAVTGEMRLFSIRNAD